MHNLNSDVVRIVLEYAYESTITPDWSIFAHYSLVSHVWSWHAQMLLYSHVRLQSAVQAMAFLKATTALMTNGSSNGSKMDIERAGRLGRAVRVMRVTISGQDGVNRRGAISSSQLAKILNACPDLYELRITTEDFPGFFSDDLISLRNTPPIQALRIIDKTHYSFATAQLLYIWPSVKHLVLKSASIWSTTEFERPPPFQLHELRWDDKDTPKSQFLVGLLSNSKETLRILHLSRPVPDYENKLGKTHGATLYSLRLPQVDLKLILSCTSLRELYLLHDDDITADLLKLLPPSVEHLAFQVRSSGTFAVENVLNYKNGGLFLKNLRVVTCYVQLDEGWDDFLSLVRRCREVGITLTSNTHSILSGNIEDLLPVTSFPRDRTVNNIYTMTKLVDLQKETDPDLYPHLQPTQQPRSDSLDSLTTQSSRTTILSEDADWNLVPELKPHPAPNPDLNLNFDRPLPPTPHSGSHRTNSPQTTMSTAPTTGSPTHRSTPQRGLTFIPPFLSDVSISQEVLRQRVDAQQEQEALELANYQSYPTAQGSWDYENNRPGRTIILDDPVGSPVDKEGNGKDGVRARIKEGLRKFKERHKERHHRHRGSANGAESEGSGNARLQVTQGHSRGVTGGGGIAAGSRSLGNLRELNASLPMLSSGIGNGERAATFSNNTMKERPRNGFRRHS